MNLKINNVTKQFGKEKALDKISFSVGQGELVGLLGPNGAGKSTLMKIITGFLIADEGWVDIGGERVTDESSKLRRYIGYLPENNPLYHDLYIREYLEIVAGFYRLKKRRFKLEEMIELTGLGSQQHKKIGELSKGYRQRVGLAQALIHDPQLLILDEPTTGLDPNQLEEIRQLIRDISRDKTVIFSSHILQEVEAICSRAVIINKGRVVADGAIADLSQDMPVGRQIVIVEFDKRIEKDLLLNIQGVADAEERGESWVIEAVSNKDVRHNIFRCAVENNLVLLTMKEKQQNLESIFRQLTLDDNS